MTILEMSLNVVSRLLVGVVAVVIAGVGNAMAAENCRAGNYLYSITRDGDQTGLLQLNVRDEGAFCRLKSREWMQNDFFGVTQYCHYMEREERWQGRELAVFQSDAYGWCSGLASTARPGACKWPEDGKPLTVRAEMVGDRLRVNGLEFVADPTEPFVTRNYMAPFFPGPNAFQVIDPIHGKLKAAKASRLDVTGPGSRYEIDGAGDRLLDYDQSGVLVKMRLTSDDVITEQVPLSTPYQKLLPEPGNEACMAVLSRP